MFIPEGDAEDYYSNLDTEYMIFYGLSPEDLAKDIDGNSKRYLQFVAGWDDGWNYATLLHEGVLADDSDSEGDLEDLDYEMAGEWIYKDYPRRGARVCSESKRTRCGSCRNRRHCSVRFRLLCF